MIFSGEIQHNEDSVVIILGGQLGRTAEGRFSTLVSQALETSDSKIEFDLGEVEFLGSGAIRILIGALKAAGERKLVACNAHGLALEALRLTGLDQWIEVVPRHPE